MTRYRPPRMHSAGYYRRRFSRRRFVRTRGGPGRGVIIVGVVVALAAAGTGGQAAVHTITHSASPASMTIHGGSGYTPQSWAAALLAAGGWPQTTCNLNAVTAWENAEGGNWSNTAQYNPLDTTQPEPGSWPVNSVNVQAYPSWQTGFRATLTTLTNGNYGPILAALTAGSSAQAVTGAVSSSPWGTASFQATC